MGQGRLQNIHCHGKPEIWRLAHSGSGSFEANSSTSPQSKEELLLSLQGGCPFESLETNGLAVATWPISGHGNLQCTTRGQKRTPALRTMLWTALSQIYSFSLQFRGTASECCREAVLFGWQPRFVLCRSFTIVRLRHLRLRSRQAYIKFSSVARARDEHEGNSGKEANCSRYPRRAAPPSQATRECASWDADDSFQVAIVPQTVSRPFGLDGVRLLVRKLVTVQ
ncbi:hypothetical protein QBC37DRAFT_404663 [Rhypophila decipiens]|uniref:Uncharacterized protein n=1 Tax=Rhypophila decipiens TaxID=261697 RepID=A0AAN7B3M3_9PEZI|nr:hypothetical protein QBC37DRAFT_404663 [Rhypophila decipiens]